jgi:hypothetical protein
MMIKLIDLGLTYDEALHGVQCAIGHEQNIGATAAPATEHDKRLHKHLKTGNAARACEHSALASLLIEKGIITEAEYLERMRLFVNHELAGYEAKHPPIHFR